MVFDSDTQMAVTIDIKTSVLYFWEEGPNRKEWLGFHITVVWVLGNSFTIRSIRVSCLEEEVAKLHRLLGKKTKLRVVLKWINLSWCLKKTIKLFLFNNISKQTSGSRIFYHVWCITRLLEWWTQEQHRCHSVWCHRSAQFWGSLIGW